MTQATELLEKPAPEALEVLEVVEVVEVVAVIANIGTQPVTHGRATSDNNNASHAVLSASDTNGKSTIVSESDCHALTASSFVGLSGIAGYSALGV